MAKTVILGAGASGRAAARLAEKLGMTPVVLTDDTFTANGTDWGDLVVASPGVPPKSPMYRAAKASGVPMISEMEFGARHCLPVSPDCGNCPLQVFCRAYAAGTVALLPVRKQRPALRDRWFTYTIYLTPTRETLIRQRTDKDIWHHLYEFPLTEHSSEPEWRMYEPAKADCQPSAVKSVPPMTHVLSHQRLHARFFIVGVNKLPTLPDTIVVTWEDIDRYALSRLTLKALEAIGS